MRDEPERSPVPSENVHLSASVACIDPLRYREIVQVLDERGIDAFHFDFCDGHFAHTLQLFPGLVRALRGLTARRFDIHLYCTHPSRFLDELAGCGADRIVVQIEAEENFADVVQLVRERGMEAGLGILPGTGVPEHVGSVLRKLHMVIANTVGPAYSGQPFDRRGLRNLGTFRSMINEQGLSVELAVDGNVCVERLPDMLGGGADHLVCGTSSLFCPGTDVGRELECFRTQVMQTASGTRGETS
jgi:ribulose-phosphate 3-epimerase